MNFFFPVFFCILNHLDEASPSLSQVVGLEKGGWMDGVSSYQDSLVLQISKSLNFFFKKTHFEFFIFNI